MNSQVPFVHLNVHTEYSLVDGIARVKELAASVRDAHMPAVAMTDVSNMYAAVKFYRACKEMSVKPLLGTEITVCGDADERAKGQMILLCRNNNGLQHLGRLLTETYIRPRSSHGITVTRSELFGAADDLIVMSGGIDSDVAVLLRAGHPDQALELLMQYRAAFGDRYYLEISRTGRPGESEYEAGVLDLAEKTGTPLVASNVVRFLRADDFEAHEIRVCIHEGRVIDDPRRPRRFTDQQYLRNGAEMTELFSDLPSAVENSIQIARRCNVFLDFESTHMPQFPLPGGRSAEEELLTQARKGLKAFQKLNPDLDSLIYQERLETEVDTINGMGFAGYFLIVADFIRWAISNGVPVGPGRGSGAGSLVAFALGITRLDPIRYGLLFERFLNPERVSLPDFDIDFCMVGRDRVIDYVSSKYGSEKVAQIITYNSLAARAVVRDVGRVMGMPYGFCDSLAKLIPFEVGMSLERALEQDDELRRRYRGEAEVSQLINNARRLEGLPRNAGKHAGGLVIAPRAISDFSPLYWEPGMTQPVTQFDKDDLEAIGLVKFDFLGLRTLTIIDWALDLVNDRRARSGKDPIVLDSLELDDPKVYHLICTGRTTALFQLESRGMQELIQRLKPDHFEELVALVALFRPGPLQSGMVDDFINRKHGREPVLYLHKALEEVLEPTYGVILYQEQVMQIAQLLAGYSLGAADLLRRAMGKKKAEEMEKQRQSFIDGAVARGVEGTIARHIFDLIEKFAGYGFNKSHSAAYALLSYHTGWLKCHYPAEFLSAALSADMEHTDRVVILVNEAKALGLELNPPDINRGGLRFQVSEGDAIIYGLGAIKGVGEKALEDILSERSRDGPFSDLFSLCRRINSQKVNRKTLEALICAGALDGFGRHRAELLGQLDGAMNAANQHGANLSSGQDDMFGLGAVNAVVESKLDMKPWSERKTLEMERLSLGLYLTGHPVDHHQGELTEMTSGPIGKIRADPERTIILAGLITGLRTFQNRRGETMAFFQLDDPTGRADISVFGGLYSKVRGTLGSEGVVIVRGICGTDDRSGLLAVKADRVLALEDSRATLLRRIAVYLSSSRKGPAVLEELQRLLVSYQPGTTEVALHYFNPSGDEVCMTLGPEWHVFPRSDLLDSLRELAGEEGVKLVFDPNASLQDITDSDPIAA